MVLAALSEPLAEELVGFWLHTAADHGLLGETVVTLRDTLRARGIPEVPFLRALSALLLSTDERARAQAREVLHALSREPALAAALAELLSYLPAGEGA